jgi:hypothetical protein
MYKGVGSERTERSPVRPSYFNPSALLHLRAPDSDRRRKVIPRRSSYLNTSTVLHIKASDRSSEGNRDDPDFDRAQIDPQYTTGAETRWPRGPSRRGTASRFVRIQFDERGCIKPVEVNPPRHAVSCRLSRVNTTHEHYSTKRGSTRSAKARTLVLLARGGS